MKQNTYKYLTFLSMLYMTVKLITVVLIYKIISIGPFSASASTFIIPFWFFLGDVITEVYGYKVTRQLIWIAIICQFIFAFICAGFISLDAPVGWAHQAAYEQVLGRLPRVAMASYLAIVVGAFVSIYAVSRWKILLHGKYFWIRSLGASAIGELIFTSVAYLTEFLGVVPMTTLLHLLFLSYLVKLLINPIMIIPSSIAVFILKKLERIDIYDVDVNYNPLRLNIGNDAIR